MECHGRNGVDADVHRLAGTDVGELRLFEVRRHPHVVLHDGEQRLTGIDVVPDINRAMADAPGHRGDDSAIRKLQFCRCDIGIGGLHLGLGGTLLSGRGGDLCIGTLHGLMRGIEFRLRGAVRRGGVVHLLAGHRVRIDRGEAIVILSRLDQIRLGDLHVCATLIEIGPLEGKLRARLRNGCLGVGALRSYLVELRLVVTRIDLQQDLAGGDMFVIDELQRGDAAGDLRRHLRHIPVHECVVGGFEIAGVQPIDRADDDQAERNQRGRDDAQQAPSRTVMVGALLGRLCHVAWSRPDTGYRSSILGIRGGTCAGSSPAEITDG